MPQLDQASRPDPVADMFARIAPRYDLLNRLMTLGRDRAWREELIRGLNLQHGELMLDVGTGSGDLAFEGLRQMGGLRVIACDFTPQMIAIARSRPGADRIQWILAAAEHLPFKDGAFDAVVSGFLLRNVADLELVLSEQGRTLKESGRIAALDTSPPKSRWLKPLLRFYLHRVIPCLGRWVAGDLSAYRYLPETTEAFLSTKELATRLKSNGFRGIGYVKRMLGTIAMHWAYK